jgi:hypothetical protein
MVGSPRGRKLPPDTRDDGRRENGDDGVLDHRGERLKGGGQQARGVDVAGRVRAGLCLSSFARLADKFLRVITSLM